jgi:hypothetical protein
VDDQDDLKAELAMLRQLRTLVDAHIANTESIAVREKTGNPPLLMGDWDAWRASWAAVKDKVGEIDAI